jgi:hypothetical protein
MRCRNDRLTRRSREKNLLLFSHASERANAPVSTRLLWTVGVAQTSGLSGVV